MSGPLFEPSRIAEQAEKAAALVNDSLLGSILADCATHLRSLGADNDRLRRIMAKRAGVLGARRVCEHPGRWTDARRQVLAAYLRRRVPRGAGPELLAAVNALPGPPIASVQSLRVVLSKMRRAAKVGQ